jgi:hypothetical protein
VRTTADPVLLRRFAIERVRRFADLRRDVDRLDQAHKRLLDRAAFAAHRACRELGIPPEAIEAVRKGRPAAPSLEELRRRAVR